MKKKFSHNTFHNFKFFDGQKKEKKSKSKRILTFCAWNNEAKFISQTSISVPIFF
jgi:hypothetical protein